ncbi:unnamed protein product [Camellia sinensis]
MIPELPTHIVFDILSRLSIKTVFNCRSVCKLWLSLISSDPQFAKLHLSRSHPSLLFKPINRIREPKKLHLVDLQIPPYTHPRNASMKLVPKINLPNDPRIAVNMLNSRNGLLCLCEPGTNDPIYVCNPILGECITLPKCPIGTICNTRSPIFGFSPMTNQYKVLRSLSRKVVNSVIGLQANGDYNEAEIYTLGEGLWRSIGKTPCSVVNDSFDAFLNGALHWLPFGVNNPDFICCYDFGSEQFRVVPEPSEFDPLLKEFSCQMRVGVLRGCLTICDFATVKDQGSIWVMKDYGVKESWSKDIVIKGVIYDWDYSNCYEPIMILQSGQLLILVNREALVLYDPKTRHHKNVKISGIRKRSDFHGIAHVPSLVSLRDVAKGENLKVLLDGTSIIDLPDQVDGLKSLEKLEMRNCRSLRSLPESIGCVLTLSTLIIVNAAITELPESIGMLENLIMLRLNKCTKLCRLPASIGNLKSLHHLLMEETAVIELPENFGMLSRLMILKMAKKPDHEVSQNAENTELPSSFSNLSLLEEFDARAWKIAGKIPDDFEKLSSLVLLNLSHNDFSSLPCSLSGLSILEKLVLSHYKYLKVLPPLPSSLIELNAANCTALESISDISNLENLQNLNLANCEKLTGIPGLERLKSLRWLYMSGCSSCSSVVKSKLDKGIVVFIDHSIQDDLRDQSPVVVDGDKIRVATQNPSPVKGLHLKKCGIHLVFENDDDYVDDENFMREGQQSVSQKLMTFMGSSEEDKQTLDPISEVEREKPKRKQRDGNSFVLLFIVLPLSFLLLSWLVFTFYC